MSLNDSYKGEEYNNEVYSSSSIIYEEEEEKEFDNSIKGVFTKPMIALLITTFVLGVLLCFFSIIILIFTSFRYNMNMECFQIKNDTNLFYKNITYTLTDSLDGIDINLDGDIRKNGNFLFFI
jgi:hypothetical protein